MILEKRALIRELKEKNREPLDVLIHVFCFFSVLLIGADKWGIDVGVNIRIDQFIILIFFLLMFFRTDLILTQSFSLFFFVIFTFISAILSLNKILGFSYYFSIIYNVIFLFFSFSNYIRKYGLLRLINILRLSLYVQFFLLILQYSLKVLLNYEIPILPAYGEYMGVPRFNLWFYEPSYLSTYLSFFLMVSAYMVMIVGDKSYLFDLFVCFIMIFISTASTGFVALAMVFVVVFYMWIKRGINLKKIITILAMIVALAIFAIIFSDTLNVFVGRLFEGNLSGASGGRIGAWGETLKVWFERPLFGVGPGNYGEYFGKDNSYVPSNITLELMATLGLPATICFYALTVSLVFKAIKINKKQKTYLSSLLYACALALIIFTIILQINQGYLRLYHWMFFGILSGGINSLKLQKTK